MNAICRSKGLGPSTAPGLLISFSGPWFDYGTISDVIIHISYEAKYDGNFKTTVEGAISDELTSFASTSGLFRLFSLRHDFPTAFYRLLNPTGAVQSTEFDVTRQHFPYFLSGKALKTTSTIISLKARVGENGQVQEIKPPSLIVNGGKPPITNWPISDQTNLLEGTVTFSGDPLRTWTINVGSPGLDKTTLDDLLILLTYTVTDN